MKKLLIQENGVVTILSVIIMASLLLFFSVLIDYARIAAFQLKTENEARTGIRSVLSAYDDSLYEKYGLFGRGGTEGKAIFTEVLGGSGAKYTGLDTRSHFDFIVSQLEEADVQTAYTLGQHDVFARQVLEEMKYKAPVDFTLEVLSKFTSLSKALKESSGAVQTLEDLRKLYEKREELLEKALSLQEKAVTTLIDNEAVAAIPAGSGSSGNSAATSLSLADRYASFARQVEHDASLPEDEEPAYSYSIASYRHSVSQMQSKLRTGGGKREQHDSLLEDALRKIEQSREVNAQMERIVEESKKATVGAYDEVAGADVAGSDDYALPNDTVRDLEEMRKSGEKLLRSSEWFQGYKQELLAQSSRGYAAASEIDQLISLWSTAMSWPLSSSRQASLQNGSSKAVSVVSAYEQDYGPHGTVMKQRRESVLDSSVKNKLSEQKAKTKSLWKQAKNMLGGLSGTSAMPEHQEQFAKVKERYQQNLLFNDQGGETAGPRKVTQAADAEDAAKESSGLMDSLFSGMSDMLLDGRDYFYFGEYAAGRFSYFAPQQLRKLLESGDTDGLSQMASFDNQELEYVLYGFHDPMGNLIAAYGELFSVRLAIRTMEGLVASRSLGHPLLILSAAIIYGLEKTMEDMISFATKGTAPISKYIKAELSYLDYLRIFMLLHGGDQEKRLGRMIAVIEHNTGLTLAQVPSGVTGEARVSMKLWFLPGVMGMLGRLDLLQGKVVGNRYETTQTVGWSY
ncbi:hypothetical protein D3P07_04220 [Paenibacillus sp. 1011MAR3C5]|uniref:hypothetical protein n=1 Tax=Paenibacillus sp. 1011MAR3C5 TaxID=1675787 RepID=UPI000E6D2A8F|nr:hypothetical protein [Paenibacillus sp. 1011MAR3C5]RJE91269.1 hypothetical protein D3P07_04220 [Paenibacillus sp. 1011MAR3C5]